MTIERTRAFRISITTTMAAQNGPIWWLAEVDVPASCDDGEAIDWIIDELEDGGMLRCDKLRVADREGQKTIVSREPAIISANVVATITLPHFRVADGA